MCIEDKQSASSSSGRPLFSWWDIQDEYARLPVKETAMTHVEAMFMPTMKPTSSSTTDSASKAAKGALKGLGKAFAGALDGLDSGPSVPIIAFKLLDLVKVNDDFEQKHGNSKGFPPATAPRTNSKQRAPPQHRASVPTPIPQQPRQAQQRPPQQQPASVQRAAPTRQPSAPQATGNLMDFGSPAPASHGGIHRSASMPVPPSNETRAEKLKREYAKKNQSSNRVWDDVDQRWVEVDPKSGFKAGTQSAPPGSTSSPSKKAVVGIKLDPSNAIGKSATVQAAVHARVHEMRESQAKAVQEVREREAKKAANEAEEDDVRKRLEPKIKAWSEEHGKKRQLRALLATLHTILWPGANWKQMSIGDLLDDAKVKRAFFMASRVVHPDKTGDLDAEKRFLAKRVFDALSQAKTEFDSGSK